MAVKIRQKTFRQKIKEPDEFITFSQRSLQYIRENTKTILLVSALGVAVIASTGFFIKWNAAKKGAFFSKTHEEVMVANSNFNANQYDEASKVFTEITKDIEKLSLFNEIAQVGIGYSLMEKKEYDKSIIIFEELIARTDFQYPKEELYKNLALLYKTTGKDDKAVEIYQKLIQLYPQSKDIDTYMNKLSKSGKFQHP